MAIKVIYLDDEPDLCEIFSDEFTSETIQVFTFSEPALAIAAAREILPDVIFVDYRLPGTNGGKVALAMPSEIPKFLMTGEIKVTTEYEFQGIFEKPIDSNKVRDCLKKLGG